MKRVYDTGEGTNSILLRVKIGTVGTAYTAVYLSRSGGQQLMLAESDADSGDITERNIGSARDLRNAYLVIITSIDFSSIGEKERQYAIDNLIIRYHLSGGFSGHQIYNHDTDDTIVIPSGSVLISKPIELI